MSEDDRHSLVNRQLPPRSVHRSHSSSPTQGLASFDEHAAASRQPHWGNSYDAPSGPHNRFRGHDMDMTTNNLFSVLARTSNDLGMQPNNHGDFQVHLVQNFSSSAYRTASFILDHSVFHKLFSDISISSQCFPADSHL